MVKHWIAILGSARDDLNIANAEQANAAARQLGRALAEKGCGIFVYSADPAFIDRHVVGGYVASGKASAESVRVIYPRRTPQPEFPEYQQQRAGFKFKVDQNQNWEVSFYRSIYAADALLLVGGGQTTFVAGILGAIRGMPILALEPYGGAASKVWELISPGELVSEDEKALMAELNASGDWADRTIDMAIAQIERQRRVAKQQELQSRRGQRAFTIQAVCAVGLLIVALALFVSTWDASLDRLRLLSALTAAPALAGAAASILRRLWEHVASGEPPSQRSVWVMALLGCAAGAVAGLLYVVAQLTALVPGEGGALPPVAGRLVPFALLTGFLAGFATDAFFRKIVQSEPPSVALPTFTSPSK